MRKFFRFFNILFIVVLSIGITFLLFPFLIQGIKPTAIVSKKIIDSLIVLQNIASSNNEYPNAAIILYNDSIIGIGYNTFFSKKDPAGHAEMNALRYAFHHYTFKEFKSLNREKLIMLTSLEPCMMCKGMLNHYKFKHIFYLESKKLKVRWYYQRKEISYYFRLKKVKSELQ